MESGWGVSVFVTWEKPGHGIIRKPLMEAFRSCTKWVGSTFESRFLLDRHGNHCVLASTIVALKSEAQNSLYFARPNCCFGDC